MEPDIPSAAAPETADEIIAGSALERAAALPVRRTAPPDCLLRIEGVMRRARRALRESGGDPRWGDAYGRLLGERRALIEHDATVRREVRAAIHRAVGELRNCRSPWALMDAAADSARLAAGFTRVLFSAVRGTRWVPLVVHTDPDIDPDPVTLQAFLDERNEIPLANLMAETEMVRRRTAVLVEGVTLALRTFKPIVEAAGSSGYVGAPIVVDNAVIGIVHGDRVGQRHDVTDDDRQAIGDFAIAFSLLFDRVTSADRLGRLSRRTERDLELARRELHQINAVPERFVARQRTVSAPRGTGLVAAEVRDELLTHREREILELVARGATNAMVAQALTVSEETVKSHMRTILRKLHVTSRNAAVARYRRAGGFGG